ncbi:MAG TPA: linear amide C-N hydrolase [Methylomirabilota bacterium]|nr:linear amide C-N hydrolase [Methylomirabilota bacterium]
MRSHLVRLAAAVSCLAVLLAGAPTDACTAFLLKNPDGPVMAKNFDWDVAAGLLVVNQRGLAKTALVGDGETPARWTSRYGSVTFNQYGREFPIGGMNEAGLAVEVLWLEATVYPPAGERRSIDPLQWVQYSLDSFRTVGEVVASASELAVSGAPLHFIACDATANCAVIEFLDGKLVQRSERTLPLPVLTNDTYTASLDYLNRTLGYGGEPVTPEGTGSLARFARAADGVQEARRSPGDGAVADALAILADVAQPGHTQWSAVYELEAGRVHFTSAGNPKLRRLDIADLDLDCPTEPLVLDLWSEGEGDVADALVPYSTEANRKVIAAGFGAEAVEPPSAEDLQRLVVYPDGLVCTFEADKP